MPPTIRIHLSFIGFVDGIIFYYHRISKNVPNGRRDERKQFCRDSVGQKRNHLNLAQFGNMSGGSYNKNENSLTLAKNENVLISPLYI